MTGTLLPLIALCVVPCLGVPIELKTTSCSGNISDEERRECYPWDNADQSKCEARGCRWCPHEKHGVSWCFMKDDVCPSNIPEEEREDCNPEPGWNKQICIEQRNCIWCPSDRPNTPWCFHDPTISQGGEKCSTNIKDIDRIDCHPDDGMTKARCLSRGCFYCEHPTPGVPWCFMPTTHGYDIVGDVQTPKGIRVELKRKSTPSWFGADIQNVVLDIEFQDDSRLRMKFYDPSSSRYEPPLNIPSPKQQPNKHDFIVNYGIDLNTFFVKIKRKTTGTLLFDTSIGGLVLSDQFLQIATRVPSTYVYGFGENEHSQLLHSMDWTKWGMYNRDQPRGGSQNLYSTMPFYECVEDDGSAHGVFFANSGAQDYSLTPAPAVVYRTIGGILDIYVFSGPTPENVVQQFTKAVGHPYMLPYWMLGFHLARYGYDNMENMKAAVGRMRKYNIPHDVQYGDIETMDRNMDFTLDKTHFADLPEFVVKLQSQGTKYIPILDPTIEIGEPKGTYLPFERGQQQDVWVKTSDGTANAEGKVWPPTHVYFPDYTLNRTTQWWIGESVEYYKTIKFDGLWLDMNEPSNFISGSVSGCSKNHYNYPMYKPHIVGDTLYDKTLCSDFQHSTGRHYDVHNVYGNSQAYATLRATRAAIPGKRSVVVSRCMFPGVSQHAVRWTGDNRSSWGYMAASIINILEFNIFGFPFIGADICGYFEDSAPELCQRWMQLGAFYPYSRNHNGKKYRDQDPGSWGDDIGNANREILHIRYTLLPYLYTLVHASHTEGGTIARPLFHEFPADKECLKIDRQFMWGSGLLITPVMEEGATSVDGYFPDAKWYDFYQKAAVQHRKIKARLDAPSNLIPLHLRGGIIIPTQQPANSTVFSRKSPMGLLVVLDPSERANGTLYADDGESLGYSENMEYFIGDYSAEPNRLTANVRYNAYQDMAQLHFEEIWVMGISSPITEVRLNSRLLEPSKYNFDGIKELLYIHGEKIATSANFVLEWS